MTNIWRLITSSCTAALLSVTFLGKTKYLQAKEATAVELKKKPKILIVGAGITGCLTSYLIRYNIYCIDFGTSLAVSRRSGS